MQAIVTKFLSPTTTKPARIKAFCSRGSITLSIHSEVFDFSLSSNCETNNIVAAQQLVNKFVAEDTTRHPAGALNNPWQKKFVTGTLPNGDYVHVFVN